MNSNKIAVPYDPEQVAGEWGWIWLPTSQGDEWVICRTIMDDDELCVETWDCDATFDTHDIRNALELKGEPYLPLGKPACEPGAGLLVCISLSGGAALSFTHEAGPGADMVREAVVAALVMPKTAAGPTTDHEQIANDEARHEHRAALERMTEERDTLIAAAREEGRGDALTEAIRIGNNVEQDDRPAWANVGSWAHCAEIYQMRIAALRDKKEPGQ